MNRRTFLGSSSAFAFHSLASGSRPEALNQRKQRIILQYDAMDPVRGHGKMHPDGAPFQPFRDALFSYADEPSSQITGIWWDVGGGPAAPNYPSHILPPVGHPLLKRWLDEGIDWIGELINETRRRKLEVFWNHRISEVDCKPAGGLEMKEKNPLKAAHPDWVVPDCWWWQGMWNLAASGLREHQVAVLQEIATRYDLDGIQMDFSRHIPCLPIGRQWEMRGEVTTFMRMVRKMLKEVALKRGRLLLLAAKVPQTLAGCHADGFDIATWSQEGLVDILTLGSRSMDVDVEGIRAAVGDRIQLQPCFDDHHATDGYRNGSIEFLRGVFANHWQRGANSVATFNWSIGTPAQTAAIGADAGPLSHQEAYHEIGDPSTLADKDKIFAIERRGGYPWADGFFNRNDTAPLPLVLAKAAVLSLHISDASDASKNRLTLRCIVFNAGERLDIRMNGTALAAPVQDAEWKDPQIFSPKPQPASGGNGHYVVNPKQRLLRLDFPVPPEAWKQGPNIIEITGSPGQQIEKVEAHLTYL